MSNMDLNIALYIGGTRKTGSSGFGFIIGVGVLAGNEHEGDMMDISPVSRASTDENPVITIKNTEEYVFYKMWDSSICPSDAKPGSRGGRLAIGVTIPSQARLKDNKSPYRLLMDIYGKFLEIGTEKTEDGLIRFRDVDLEKTEFVKIIENYPLEEVSIKTAVMKGDTIAEIQVPIEKMEDFFRDTQYPEFTHYKAVEVTTKGKNMFPSLEIPRPVSYEVFINGNSSNKFLKDRNDRFRAEITDEDNEDVEYDTFNFSLGELLDNKDNTRKNQAGTVEVKLDKNRRRIDCKMKSKPVLYSWKPWFSHDSDPDAIDFVKKGLKNKTIRIRLDGKELDADDSIKASVAKAVKKEQIDIYPHEIEGFILSVHKVEPDGFNRVVVIAIKAKINDNKVGETNRENRERNHNLMDFIIGGVIGLALGIGGTLGTLRIIDVVGQNNDTKKESSAYQRALASSDTTVMKNYIYDYSEPQFMNPNEEHLFAIMNKLDSARLEAAVASEETKAETEAYNKCYDETKSLDDRIAVCEAYIEAKYTKNKPEIEQLRNKLKTDKDMAETEEKAFKKYKEAQFQPYPGNYKACLDYNKGKYSNDEHMGDVREYIEKIENGRNAILKLLNNQELTKFNTNYGENKWKQFITAEERSAVSNILKPDYGTDKNARVEEAIEAWGFPKRQFQNWNEVEKLKKELDNMK